MLFVLNHWFWYFVKVCDWWPRSWKVKIAHEGLWNDKKARKGSRKLWKAKIGKWKAKICVYESLWWPVLGNEISWWESCFPDLTTVLWNRVAPRFDNPTMQRWGKIGIEPEPEINFQKQGFLPGTNDDRHSIVHYQTNINKSCLGLTLAFSAKVNDSMNSLIRKLGLCLCMIVRASVAVSRCHPVPQPL